MQDVGLFINMEAHEQRNGGDDALLRTATNEENVSPRCQRYIIYRINGNPI